MSRPGYLYLCGLLMLGLLLLPQKTAAQSCEPAPAPIAADSLVRTLELPPLPAFRAGCTATAAAGDRGALSHTLLRDPSEQFRAKQLILPLSLVAVSSFGTWDARAKQANRAVRNQFEAWRGDARLHFDDYVQYVPAAAYLTLGVAGARSRHNFKERMVVLGTSWLSMGVLVNAVKYSVREPRPDRPQQRNSYPSGHTATAFMGAELVRREYGTGYGVAAYAVACGIGVMRMYNDRHWLNDVLAGAGIGILSAEIGYWMLPLTRRLFGMKAQPASGMMVAAAPFYDPAICAFGGGIAVRLF